MTVPSDLIRIGQRVIEREAKALFAFAPTLGDSFLKACQLIYDCRGTVLLTGMGKSGLVARKWSSTFSSTGTKSYFISPAEAPHGDLGIFREGDLLIGLSFSGETEELGYVLRHAREMALPTIAVTGSPNSSLARQGSVVLSVSLSEEACPLGLAPTTSTTLLMSLGDALAVTLMQMRGFTEKDFARLHPGGALGRKLWLKVGSLMHSGSDMPVVSPDDSLEEVLLEMTTKRLGLAVVMQAEKVSGIITDGDLRRYFQRTRLRANENPRAKDLMTENPIMISHRSLAVEAREKMEKSCIQHILIHDDDSLLVGVVHFQDLLRAKAL